MSSHIPCFYRSFRFHCNLKVTFLNDLGSRSKRHLEEFEEGDRPDMKRQCCMKCRCSPSQAHSLSNGRAASPVSLLNSSGYIDDDLDDTILDRSDEEKPDSPTGLSREAEDELIAEDLETSPNSVAVEVNSCEDVKKLCDSMLASPESAQTLRAPDEVEGTKPLPQTGSSASSSEGVVFRNYSEKLNSGKYLNKSSQNQAEFGANCNGLRFPEAGSDIAASLNLEKERDPSGEIDKEVIKIVTNDLSIGSQLVAEHESFGAVGEQSSERHTSLNHRQLRGKSTSNPLPAKELDTVDLHGEAAVSTCVSGQREECVSVPDAKSTNSPVKPRRICIQEAELESRKESYVNAVLTHASSVPFLIDSVHEMRTLVDTVASESRNGHPTDLTVRNYAKRSQSTTQRVNLNQWVDRNMRNIGRFDGIPDHFKRSPILS
ncbi:S100P-binding protein isoform X1 [Python bivittatus]|uniref:S100P-binding protein n=1 Tax=Python bivittatus TaxID=176946 RepID=A0A9F2R924_PYTBI|nr:S100P-binding protein isoform X1 [Python bivittatus]